MKVSETDFEKELNEELSKIKAKKAGNTHYELIRFDTKNDNEKCETLEKIQNQLGFTKKQFSVLAYKLIEKYAREQNIVLN